MLKHYKQLAHLSETLYGGVFLCQAADNSSPEASSGARLAVLKLVDLRCAMAMLNRSLATATTSTSTSTSAHCLDDPRQEKAVANVLRRTGGHANVVTYLDDVIADGVLYFVMEFCSGGDLHGHVNRSSDEGSAQRPAGSVAPREALAMAHDIASGLQFLHANEIAHRDLSLENVLLQDGVCKLADFGLSTRTTRRCTERVGKAYYMAPEVAAATGDWEDDSSVYDPKAADMWSFGIVLFILLTGSPLVPSASADDKAFCVFQRVGVAGVLDAWGMHHIPRAMRDLLNGLLQVNPRDRYTVEQVLAHEAFTLLQQLTEQHGDELELMDATVATTMSCHQQEESQQHQHQQRCTQRVSADGGFVGSSLIET